MVTTFLNMGVTMTGSVNLIVKTTIGAALAAFSVVLKLVFDLWLKTDFFGFPFYSIPLILSGIFLGPVYGLVVGAVADTVSGLFLGYLPGFIFSSLAWSVIPALLTKKPKGAKWLFVILITYLSASLFNTFAIWFHFSKKAAFSLFWIRISLIPIFGSIIAILTNIIYERTEPLLKKYRF